MNPRDDILRWAEEAAFTPTMSLENPESIVTFIEWCCAQHPDEFTQEHGTEIFAWCKEGAPFRLARDLQ